MSIVTETTVSWHVFLKRIQEKQARFLNILAITKRRRKLIVKMFKFNCFIGAESFRQLALLSSQALVLPIRVKEYSAF